MRTESQQSQSISLNLDVQTGGLVDELEWVRTDISFHDGWNFVESRVTEGTPDAIENSAVAPVHRRQN